MRFLIPRVAVLSARCVMSRRVVENCFGLYPDWIAILVAFLMVFCKFITYCYCDFGALLER